MLMIKINKHIEIVRTTQKELSSMSQESCDAIFSVLNKHYATVRVTTVDDLTDLKDLVMSQPDLVFLGMKFLPVNPELGRRDPDKIWIAQYLDENGINYTGSNHLAHQLELDKPLAKQRALDFGLNTSPFYVAKQNQQQAEKDMLLTFPLFIKPSDRGGGLGIDGYSVAHNMNQLHAKVRSITIDLGSDSLVEEYLPGREFSVAVLRNHASDGFSVMPIELVAPADTLGVQVLSEQVKSANAEQVIEVTDKTMKTKVTALALNIFGALGARDYGRIDIRLDEFEIPHFLEANLLPSLISGYGSFPKACWLNSNLDYETMILNIVGLAFARQPIIDKTVPEPNIPLTVPLMLAQP